MRANEVQWARDPIERCQELGRQIWMGEHGRIGLGLGGLNTEAAIRARLRAIVNEMSAASDPAAARAVAAAHDIEWEKLDPLGVLERTERLVTEFLGGPDRAHDPLEGPPHAALTARLLVTQSLGGRLGRWAVRDAELPDARTARRLYKKLGPQESTQYQALFAVADELSHAGRHEAAAVCLLDADRTVRTPSGLYRAAIALWRGEDYSGALWAIRACLLEEPASFKTTEALFEAHRAESSLRALVEDSQVPVPRDEVPPPLARRASRTGTQEPPRATAASQSGSHL
jgi:hypothetical protein